MKDTPIKDKKHHKNNLQLFLKYAKRVFLLKVIFLFLIPKLITKVFNQDSVSSSHSSSHTHVSSDKSSKSKHKYKETRRSSSAHNERKRRHSSDKKHDQKRKRSISLIVIKYCMF